MTGQPDSPAGLSFERDVRPMFREKDRDSMLKAFDLWSHSDVQAHNLVEPGVDGASLAACDG
jgi:hypothetical protein